MILHSGRCSPQAFIFFAENSLCKFQHHLYLFVRTQLRVYSHRRLQKRFFVPFAQVSLFIPEQKQIYKALSPAFSAS